MAVSNSLGSNVFDILLGLSVPWFIKTAIASSGSTVNISLTNLGFAFQIFKTLQLLRCGMKRFIKRVSETILFKLFILSYVCMVTIIGAWSQQEIFTSRGLFSHLGFSELS